MPHPFFDFAVTTNEGNETVSQGVARADAHVFLRWNSRMLLVNPCAYFGGMFEFRGWLVLILTPLSLSLSPPPPPISPPPFFFKQIDGVVFEMWTNGVTPGVTPNHPDIWAVWFSVAADSDGNRVVAKALYTQQTNPMHGEKLTLSNPNVLEGTVGPR
jgi:hypothetical protein